MDPRCKGMPLSSFILKPMQRVTRYPLIIKNVSNCLAFSSRGMLSQQVWDLGSGAGSPANTPGICCVETIYQQATGGVCMVTLKEKLDYCESVSRSVCLTLCDPHGLWSTGLLCPWDSPGQNTGVHSQSLLQGIFPTQGLNLGLLHCRQSLYSLSQQGSPRKVYCEQS